MLIVDDSSRMMWVYLLPSKHEAFTAFMKFKLLIENQTDLKIKVMRTDRGGEFCGKIFNEFCEAAGIKRHLTAPYTPQQNGVVERRNRTVLEMAQSLLKSATLPSTF